MPEVYMFDFVHAHNSVLVTVVVVVFVVVYYVGIFLECFAHRVEIVSAWNVKL